MKEPYDRLGRYLAAAVIANRMGISLDRAFRDYTKNGDIAESWVRLGELLDQGVAEGVSGFIRAAMTATKGGQ